MGRRKGSTNSSSHHKAGGARAGSGRPTKYQVQSTTLDTIFGGPATEQATFNTEQAPALFEQQSTENCDRLQRPLQVERHNEKLAEAIETLKRLSLEQEDGSIYGEESDTREDTDDPIDYDLDPEEGAAGDDNRQKYMPPNGSTLAVYLELIKDEFLRSGSKLREEIIKHGRHWIPPSRDPVTAGCEYRPDDWYTRNVWCFIWLPFYQYEAKFGLEISKFPCIHCAKAGCKSHQYGWRPMFYHDKIVWVLHRRLKCMHCKRTFATIDPHFMSQLPTCVAECFPFVTTPSGIGIHESMVYTFAYLATNKILFGTYADMINELHSIQYDKTKLSYLDRASEYCDRMEQFQGGEVPAVFSAFASAGEYNGIRLSQRLLKSVFRYFMQGHEPYMQSYFQTCHDEGVATDHTHKYAKLINASALSGKIFHASYTVTSLHGKIVCNRLTFTKSSLELEPVVQGIKEVRENVGQSELLRHETDNINGDGKLWRELGGLKNDSVGYKSSANSSLAVASISKESYVYMKTVGAVRQWALAMVPRLHLQEDEVLLGLDCEWNFHDGTQSFTRLLQLAFPNAPVAVLNLSEMKVKQPEDFPKELKSLLEFPCIVACGRLIGTDCSRLEKLGVNIARRLDLRGLALRQCQTQEGGTSLEALCQHYLGLNLNKSGQDADYSQTPLPPELIEYAALDALVSLKLAQKLLFLIREVPHETGVMCSPEGLQVEDKVDYFCQGKIVATAKVIFVGGEGQMRKWGAVVIGSRRALIQLEQIYYPSVKPPISDGSFDRKSTTIGDLFSKLDKRIIAVRTSSLLKQLPSSSMTPSDMTASNNNSSQEKPPYENYSVLRALDSTIMFPPLNSNNNFLPVENSAANTECSPVVNDTSILNSDEIQPIRSRQKEDIWHQFHSLPLPKACPLKPLIIRLLIHATFTFVESDFGQVKLYLSEKENVTNFMEHFYFNKEWWRQRVRMVTPDAANHAYNIRSVHHFLQTNPAMAQYYTADMNEYFKRFEQKCLQGYFEELADVSMFIHQGNDRNGLDLWLRCRGSVRTENVHQKMKSCIGSWGVGAETAHYLLVLLCYRYNISAGIKWYNEHNFGHPYLHLIDRIQIQTQRIYDVLIFPKHNNVSMFISVPFISIGIGPLSHSEDYIEKGPPDPILKGDIRFIAEKMGVVFPPIPFSTSTELKMFNDWILSNPKPNERQREKFAAMFKDKSNGSTIFPKLPTMVKEHEKRWETNNQIQLAQKTMHTGYTQLLDGLACIHAPNPLEQQAQEINLNIEMAQDNEPSGTLVESTPLFVPPISAPFQQQFQPGDQSTKVAAQLARACANAPLCDCLAKDCGGWMTKTCKNFDKICPIELASLRTTYRNEKRRKQRSEERQNKKNNNSIPN